MALVNHIVSYMAGREEEGQGMVEYGLIIALVAIIAAAGFLLLGEGINEFIAGLVDEF